MKKIFVLTMVLGFLLMGSLASAWQDPCNATENAYVCEGFTLDNWVEKGLQFSPAPKCAGTVILWAPDGTGYQLDYIGNNDEIILSGYGIRIPCRVSNQGNLVCKIVTVPEESTILTFAQE